MSTCMFHGSSRICDTYTIYQCNGSGCGANAQQQTVTQYCSGKSSSCDGEKMGVWSTLDNCRDDEICKSDKETYAECTPCQYGCSEELGKCWPQCNPNSDPCCEPDGKNIAWYDEKSGLCWEKKKDIKSLTWENALDYCKDLGQGWMLPNIDALRSLVRECPSIEWDYKSGKCIDDLSCCEVNTKCLDAKTCCLPNATNCGASSYESCSPDSCENTTSVCLWDFELGTGCNDQFWSSSIRADATEHAWCVDFRREAEWRVASHGIAYTNQVKCVKQIDK